MLDAARGFPLHLPPRKKAMGHLRPLDGSISLLPHSLQACIDLPMFFFIQLHYFF
jgi:hypothetical protein